MPNNIKRTPLPKKMPRQRARGLKLIANEFNSTIFSAMLFGTIMAAFSLISVFVHGDYIGQSDTFGTVAQSLSQAIMFSIINRIRLVVRDKSTLDRNRAMFLTNKKEIVVFSKVIVDLFSFMIPIFMAMIIGLPVIASKGGVFGSDFAVKLTAFVFAIMVAYLFSTFGMRLITSLEIKKFTMWNLLGYWTLFTLIWMIGAGIAFGILGGQEATTVKGIVTKGMDPHKALDVHLSLQEIAKYKTDAPITSFLVNNQTWLACVPFMNFLTPFMVLYGFMDMWTVAPLIGECMIAIIFAWRPVSTVLKTYLTT